MPSPAEEALLVHLRTIRPLWTAFLEGLSRRDRLRAYLRIQALPEWQRHEIRQRLAVTEERLQELDGNLALLERKTPDLDQRVAEETGATQRKRQGRTRPKASQHELPHLRPEGGPSDG